jgi:hydroxypyruvate reductase
VVAIERDRLRIGDATTRAARELALDLAEAGLRAVDPERATVAALDRLEAAGEPLDRATLFAFGKGAVPMARAAASRVRLRGGIVIALEEATLPGLDVRRGGHPHPAPDALDVGVEVERRARALGPDDVALCLVSGGGSSMLEKPRDGVALDEIAELARSLMAAGADIAELNAVRRALSAIKGGGLAHLLAPARIVTVVLSDVPGQDPALVASGPTAAPPADAPVARTVLARCGLWSALSDAARAAVQTPRPSPPPWRLEVAADHTTARRAIVDAAAQRGTTLVDRDGVFGGEARELGAALALEAPLGFVWAGETTVTVRGPGRGGRNLEVALGALAAAWERGWSGGPLIALGTDGVDGTSDAAGALIDGHALATARALGLDPRRALADNDAHTFFAALGTALHTGPTGTNVADLIVRLP